MAQYGSAAYWNARYEGDGEFFDWYQRWETLKPALKGRLSRQDRILVIGCGRSKLSADLYKDGYHKLLSMDVSPVAIKANREAYAGKLPLEFKVMDVTNMSEEKSASFDVVFDKGCLDCLACAEDASTKLNAALAEISRVLRPGGRYIYVSYGEPAFRTPFLESSRYDWTLEITQVDKPTLPHRELVELTPDVGRPREVHYVYICTRPAHVDTTSSY